MRFVVQQYEGFGVVFDTLVDRIMQFRSAARDGPSWQSELEQWRAAYEQTAPQSGTVEYR